MLQVRDDVLCKPRQSQGCVWNVLPKKIFVSVAYFFWLHSIITQPLTDKEENSHTFRTPGPIPWRTQATLNIPFGGTISNLHRSRRTSLWGWPAHSSENVEAQFATPSDGRAPCRIQTGGIPSYLADTQYPPGCLPTLPRAPRSQHRAVPVLPRLLWGPSSCPKGRGDRQLRPRSPPPPAKPPFVGVTRSFWFHAKPGPCYRTP